MDPSIKQSTDAVSGTKMKRRDLVVDDDDDFVTCPPSKRTSIVKFQSRSGESSTLAGNKPRKEALKAKKIKDAGSVVVEKNYERLIYRASPQVLVLAVEKLNEAQKKDVVDMGFGSILFLTVKNVPTKLAFWVLDNFNARSCDIRLKDSKKLHITSDDVYRVFGFPRGDKKVERKENNEQVDSYHRWMEHFGEKKYGVTTRDVLAEITREGGEGASGELFRRNFMILVNSCLIESNSTGYVKPQIMDCLEDVTSLHNWDWCSYVIDRLVHHKGTWEKNKNNAFCGPILFLTALYLDRVEFNGKKLYFAYPTIKYCTSDDMKRRQIDEIRDGGFGDGYLAEPLDVPCEILLPATINHSNVNNKDNSEEDLLNFAEKFMGKVKDVGSMMTELMSMIEGASEQIVKSEIYPQVINAAMKLLVFDPNIASSSTSPRQSQFWNSENQHEFWRQADKSAILVEIEKAIEKRKAFLKVFNDVPSFSLGLTQDLREEGHDCRNNGFEPTGMITLSCGNTSLRSVNSNLGDAFLVENAHELNVSPNDICEKGRLAVKFGKDIDNVNLHPISKGKEKVVVDGEDVALTEIGGCVQGAKIVKDNVEKSTYQIVTRGKRYIKKSMPLLSPYQKRIVDSSEKINMDDRVICFWVMHNTDVNGDEVLYSNGNIKLTRKDFLTLGPNKFISRRIIDVWSTIANKKEEYRAPSSPLRFFATTNVCLHTVVDAPREMELDERMLDFQDNLKLELNMVPQIDLKKIDLFFFPILEAENCYLICVDVKTIAVDILDHTQLQDVKDNLKKYGLIPVILKSFIVDFLKINGETARSKKLKDAFIYGESIPWADDQNKIDCGVFAMRHMETYLGESNFNKEMGFKRNSTMQTRYMRIKYCAAIITSETNDVASEDIKEAKSFYARNCLEGPKAIDKVLLGK